MSAIYVYGTDWCEDTQMTREHLNELGLPYQYINIELDPNAAAWVKHRNHGKQITPTIDIGGQVLIEPQNAELDHVLRKQGLLV